jgi:hypothetical protein
LFLLLLLLDKTGYIESLRCDEVLAVEAIRLLALYFTGLILISPRSKVITSSQLFVNFKHIVDSVETSLLGKGM